MSVQAVTDAVHKHMFGNFNVARNREDKKIRQIETKETRTPDSLETKRLIASDADYLSEQQCPARGKECEKREKQEPSQTAVAQNGKKFI